MEIKYPIIIIISIILFVLAFFISLSKIKSRKHKKKVANTSIVKESKEYKSLLFKYRIGMYIIYAIIFVCLLSSSLLSSRIVKTQVIENEIYNRDIILCMDVSTSVDDLNKELVESYKEVVKSLNGERFGISIFNTSSYTLVPLTEDYDYVLGELDTISKALTARNSYDYSYDVDNYLYLNRYLLYGTIVGNETRGSSIIGDGLAACVFSFPNLEEDRSRIIIFSTDNDLQGKEYISLVDAGKLSKSKNITVYTIAPSITTSRFGKDLETVANTTGGKYFVQGRGETIENIVNGIESQEKTLLKGNSKTVVIDYPEVPYILLLLGFVGLIVVDKVVLE